METIYEVETGKYVSSISPLELTEIETDAMGFYEAEIGDTLDALNGSGEQTFAKGRPTDRQPH